MKYGSDTSAVDIIAADDLATWGTESLAGKLLTQFAPNS